MKILVSNDDGVHATGIRALANELQSIAELKVIAPDRNRSAASSSLTLTRPLRVARLENGYYSVEGTPTDCVHLGLTGLFIDSIDMVVSGINEGVNLGEDIWYSGTVAAAVEGRYLGLPAIALSMVCSDGVKHYETGAIVAKKLVEKIARENLPSQTILNVNIPDVPYSQIKGMQVTRLGSRHSSAPVIKDVDPRGNPIYWIGKQGAEVDAGAGTDFDAVNNNYVSITPLHLDMSNYNLFDRLCGWLEDIKI